MEEEMEEEMVKEIEEIEAELIEAALQAREKSYAPYSHFKVGAALMTMQGKIYSGCNIENAAYSPTNCAERTAFFKAVSEGERSFRAIAIVGGDAEAEQLDYCAPCGVCRQVMMEFCDPESFFVILAKSADIYSVYSLEELLPLGFHFDYREN
jgi:cytidine deaminase